VLLLSVGRNNAVKTLERLGYAVTLLPVSTTSTSPA
jgi:hypothetical protein